MSCKRLKRSATLRVKRAAFIECEWRSARLKRHRFALGVNEQGDRSLGAMAILNPKLSVSMRFLMHDSGRGNAVASVNWAIET